GREHLHPRRRAERRRARGRGPGGAHRSGRRPRAAVILAEREGVTYRYAGDRALLVEYGEMELDLTLNFRVLAVDDALRADPPDGLVETAPGFRSILLSYERVRPERLVEHLDRIHAELEGAVEIPSRLLNLPIAF